MNWKVVCYIFNEEKCSKDCAFLKEDGKVRECSLVLKENPEPQECPQYNKYSYIGELNNVIVIRSNR